MKNIVKIVFLFIVSIAIFFGIVANVHAIKPSDYGLKEGDLISAIFSNDPDVYIINDKGYKRLFLNPEIFNFYGHLGGFLSVKLVTPEVRDAFATSGLFRDCEDNDPKVYGIDIDGEDTGKLRWINVSANIAMSEDPEFFDKVFCINKKELAWYPKSTEFKAVKDVPKYERMGGGTGNVAPAKIEANSELKEIGKVVICHHATESEGLPQEITVDASALKAHLEHGDTVGVCPGPTPTPTPTTTPTQIPTPTPITTVTPTPTPTPTPNGGGTNPTPTPTPSPTDTTSPILSNITTSNITGNSVAIYWITNENSNGIVLYSTSSSSLTLSSLGTTLSTGSVFQHNITLSGLTGNTSYYFQASSTDTSGNTAESSIFSFKTLAESNWSTPKKISADGGSSPNIVWQGDKYAIVWTETLDGGINEKLLFAFLDENGNKIGNDLILDQTSTRSIDLNTPVITWGNDGYGVVWAKNGNTYYNENCSLYFIKVGISGNKLTDNILVTSGQYGQGGSCPNEPSIVWTGTEYGVVWHENNTNLPSADKGIYFARFNTDGIKQGANIVLLSPPWSFVPTHPSLVWSGSEYGLAFYIGNDMYFSRFDSNGVKQGERINLATGDNLYYSPSAPYLARNDTGYAVVWIGMGTNQQWQLFLAKISNEGVLQGDAVQITNSVIHKTMPINPAIIWANSEYGLSWMQDDNHESNIYFAHMSFDGILDENSKVFVADYGTSGRIVWTGTKFGIVWHGRNVEISNVYFATGN